MSVAVRCENMENSMPPPPLPPQRRPPPPVNRPYKRRALFQITKVRDYNIRGRRYPSAAAGRGAPVTTLSDDDAAARHFEQTQLIFFTIDTYFANLFSIEDFFLSVHTSLLARPCLRLHHEIRFITSCPSVCLLYLLLLSRLHGNMCI